MVLVSPLALVAKKFSETFDLIIIKSNYEFLVQLSKITKCLARYVLFAQRQKHVVEVVENI